VTAATPVMHIIAIKLIVIINNITTIAKAIVSNIAV